jgi:hypothetical protein
MRRRIALALVVVAGAFAFGVAAVSHAAPVGDQPGHSTQANGRPGNPS